jgi:hypothetical protein
MCPRAPLAVLLVLACASRAPTPSVEHGDVRRTSSPPLELAVEHRIALEAPARVDGRIGAVQVEVRLRNEGRGPVSVVADPWLGELSVSSDRGAVRCAPSSARMQPPPLVELAPGASVPLRIDVAARCDLAQPGEYDLDVSFGLPGAKVSTARVRLAIAPRTWVNPGPR